MGVRRTVLGAERRCESHCKNDMLNAWHNSSRASERSLVDRVDSLVAAGRPREPVGGGAARRSRTSSTGSSARRSGGRSSRPTPGGPETAEELGRGRRGSRARCWPRSRGDPEAGRSVVGGGAGEAPSGSRRDEDRRDPPQLARITVAPVTTNGAAGFRPRSSLDETDGAAASAALPRSTTFGSPRPDRSRDGSVLRLRHAGPRSAARSRRSPTARSPGPRGFARARYRERSRRALTGSLATGSPNA